MNLVEALKVALSTTFSLYFKTHVYHWNVVGPMFPQLHALFQKQYTDLWHAVDDIAEQIRQQDEMAPVSLPAMLACGTVPDDHDLPDTKTMLLRLVEGHEAAIMVMNGVLIAAQEIGDEAVANFAAERLEAHSKMRWMLKATAA